MRYDTLTAASLLGKKYIENIKRSKRIALLDHYNYCSIISPVVLYYQ